MAVSPWQFKNINGEAWVENSDYLWKYRWEQAINGMIVSSFPYFTHASIQR